MARKMAVKESVRVVKPRNNSFQLLWQNNKPTFTISPLFVGDPEGKRWLTQKVGQFPAAVVPWVIGSVKVDHFLCNTCPLPR